MLIAMAVTALHQTMCPSLLWFPPLCWNDWGDPLIYQLHIAYCLKHLRNKISQTPILNGTKNITASKTCTKSLAFFIVYTQLM